MSANRVEPESPKVRFKDVTLREGSQAAPVSFTAADKRTIAAALQAFGVAAIQVGFAGRDDEDISLVREACPTSLLEVLVPAWNQRALDSLASAYAAGANMCGIIVRSTAAGLATMGYTPEQAVDRLREVASAAREIGYTEIRIALSMASKADPAFRNTLYASGLDAGATAIAYADTTGTATPRTIRDSVSEITTAFPQAVVHVHMHNDFGLAVANSLAAVEAGASWVDATVNGLGERAGNCPLEEVVLAFEVLENVRTGLNLSQVCSLSELVAALSGQPVPRMKAIVGEDCFTNKLDLHVAAVQDGRNLLEPFEPSLIGRERSIKLGFGSGPAALRAVAEQERITLPDDVVNDLVRDVNDLAVARKRCVTVDEFRTLVADRADG